MLDCIVKEDKSKRPRILGLTASFISGSMKNPEKKKTKLEEVLQSKMISPNTSDLQLQSRNFEKISWEPEKGKQEQAELIKTKMNEFLDNFQGHPKDILVKDKSKIVSRAVHVFENLGQAGFKYYLHDCITYQLKRQAEVLRELNINEHQVHKMPPSNLCTRCLVIHLILVSHQVTRLLASIADLEKQLKRQEQQRSAKFPPSSKFDRLGLLLRELKAKHAKGDSEFRGLIFVEQVALAFCLSHVLNQHSFHTAPIAGIGGVTQHTAQYIHTYTHIHIHTYTHTHTHTHTMHTYISGTPVQ